MAGGYCFAQRCRQQCTSLTLVFAATYVEGVFKRIQRFVISSQGQQKKTTTYQSCAGEFSQFRCIIFVDILGSSLPSDRGLLMSIQFIESKTLVAE